VVNSNTITFSIRQHKTRDDIALVIEQGEDIIVIPVETEELGFNLADDIAKAINVYSSCFPIAVKEGREE